MYKYVGVCVCVCVCVRVSLSVRTCIRLCARVHVSEWSVGLFVCSCKWLSASVPASMSESVSASRSVSVSHGPEACALGLS